MYRDFKKALKVLDMYSLFLKCHLIHKTWNNYPKYIYIAFTIYIYRYREYKGGLGFTKEILSTDLKGHEYGKKIW